MLLDFLKHIEPECNFILLHTEHKSREDVIDNELICKAVVRSLEIIGEAVKKLDDDFRIRYPYMEWKKIAGTRDVMIHHYFGVDYDILT